MKNFQELKVYLDIILPACSEEELNLVLDYVEKHRVDLVGKQWVEEMGERDKK